MTDKQRQWCDAISLALWQPGVPMGLRAQALDALNRVRETFDWAAGACDARSADSACRGEAGHVGHHVGHDGNSIRDVGLPEDK